MTDLTKVDLTISFVARMRTFVLMEIATLSEVDEANRSGADIAELQNRHRALELRVERLDATIEILRENRRSHR